MSNFPDKKYFAEFLQNLKTKIEKSRTEEEQLLVYSGALDWLGDFLTDENITWEKRTLNLNDLYLAGTDPEWNKVVIDCAERSPKKLRAIFAS